MKLKLLIAVVSLGFGTMSALADVASVVVSNDSKGTPTLEALKISKVAIGTRVIPNQNCWSLDLDCRDREVAIYEKRPVLVVSYLSKLEAPRCDRELDFGCVGSNQKASIVIPLNFSDLNSYELSQLEGKLSKKASKALAQSIFKVSYLTQRRILSYWGGCEYNMENNRTDPHCREVQMFKEGTQKLIRVERK